MNNVIDEVLAGSPRYTIKDNGGTTLYDNVQIDLKTQVTTAGTPLNKALFDSIQSDLNTRLLISNKATTSDAQTGTNDVKYMTAQKVQDKFNYLITSNSSSSTGTHTVCTFANYTNAKIITISGKLKGGSGVQYILNGSLIGGFTTSGNQTNSSAFTISNATNSSDQGFMFRFDLTSNSFVGFYPTGSGNAEMLCGRFSSITNFQIKITSSGRSYEATVQANS